MPKLEHELGEAKAAAANALQMALTRAMDHADQLGAASSWPPPLSPMSADSSMSLPPTRTHSRAGTDAAGTRPKSPASYLGRLRLSLSQSRSRAIRLGDDQKRQGSSLSPPRENSPRKFHKARESANDQYELTLAMMLGIRHTVGKIEAKRSREVVMSDFLEAGTFRFPKEGSSKTPGHSLRSFKFKDYDPMVFRHLRRRFGIDPAEYQICLCGEHRYIEFISNSKSGQFFYYSHDRQYMIKTLSSTECRFLRKILPSYYNYVMRYKDTLVTRFFGLHRVKLHKGRKRHFVIMGSVFNTDKFIHERFDLKGATHGRRATEEEKEQDVPVLKDLDFLESGLKIEIGHEKALALINQLSRDAAFLKELKIMDYSVLLGVHYADRPLNISDQSEDDNTSNDARSKGHRRRQSHYGLKPTEHIIASPVAHYEMQVLDEQLPLIPDFANLSMNDYMSRFCDFHGGCRSVNGERVFFFDILQQYNSKKQFEHMFKSLKYDKSTISAVNPAAYAQRFIEFMKNALVQGP